MRQSDALIFRNHAADASIRQISLVNYIYETITDKGPTTYQLNLLRLWYAIHLDTTIPRVSVIQTADPREERLESMFDDADELSVEDL